MLSILSTLIMWLIGKKHLMSNGSSVFSEYVGNLAYSALNNPLLLVCELTSLQFLQQIPSPAQSMRIGKAGYELPSQDLHALIPPCSNRTPVWCWAGLAKMYDAEHDESLYLRLCLQIAIWYHLMTSFSVFFNLILTQLKRNITKRKFSRSRID